MRRLLANMSQEELGAKLGLSFQQIQKYENGANRISARRLFQIAELLQVPIEFFYGGLKAVWALRSVHSSEEKEVISFLSTSEGLSLNRQFSRIKSPKLRQQVLSLVAALATEGLTMDLSIRPSDGITQCSGQQE